MKKRNKEMCKRIKRRLIKEYSYYCFICGRYDKEVQLHHVIPRYAGGKDDYSNSSLICDLHHKELHQYDYGTKEYSKTIEKIERYKKLHFFEINY